MKTNKMWQRALSLIMVICMISGMCVTSVFAEEETESKDTEPKDVAGAIKVTLDFADTIENAPTSGNVGSWYGFGEKAGTYKSISFAEGDKLSYKLYIPSDGNYAPGMGTMDVQENSAWKTLSWQSGIKDQNGNAYSANLATLYGENCWIEIVYDIPAALVTGGGIQHIGPRNNFGAAYLEELAGKTAYYYLDDVKIVHADGTETVIVPPQTQTYATSAKDALHTYATTTFEFVPEEVGNAVKISVEFGSSFESIPTSGNVSSWYGFGEKAGAYKSTTVQEGDKLSYKIYIPSDGNYVPGMGTMDVQENSAWKVMSWQSGVTDQNGNAYSANLATLYGENRWIEIVYDIPAILVGGGIQHIGPRNNFAASYLAELEGETAYYYVTDVKLVHADGTETVFVPSETQIYAVSASDTLHAYATVSSEYVTEETEPEETEPEETEPEVTEPEVTEPEETEPEVSEPEETQPEETNLAGVSMALGDDLAVKFHVKMDAAVAAEAVMEITLGNGNPVTVKAADAQKDTDGNYIFAVHVAAAQMNDTIVLKQIYNGEITEIATYTVRQYAEAVLQDASLVKYHNLVKHMLNYGAMAQVYFDYNADTLANDGITVTVADVPQGLEENMAISGAVDGISFYGATAVFRSKTAIRYYFKVSGDISTYTFTVGETAYEPVAKDDMYYIEVPGVNPQQIDETVTLNVTDGTDTLSVTYSPLCYIVRMYNGKGSDSLKQMLKALYSYYLEAEAVTENQGSEVEQQPNYGPNQTPFG